MFYVATNGPSGISHYSNLLIYNMCTAKMFVLEVSHNCYTDGMLHLRLNPVPTAG